MTVRGPVKKQQPDAMSHRGGAGPSTLLNGALGMRSVRPGLAPCMWSAQVVATEDDLQMSSDPVKSRIQTVGLRFSHVPVRGGQPVSWAAIKVRVGPPGV